jgi:hypothetical protein
MSFPQLDDVSGRKPKLESRKVGALAPIASSAGKTRAFVVGAVGVGATCTLNSEDQGLATLARLP